jgi:hypothetical protein
LWFDLVEKTFASSTMLVPLVVGFVPTFICVHYQKRGFLDGFFIDGLKKKKLVVFFFFQTVRKKRKFNQFNITVVKNTNGLYKTVQN